MWTTWRYSVFGGTLAVLGLVVIGPQEARAQVYYDGGFVPFSQSRRAHAVMPPPRHDPHPPMRFHVRHLVPTYLAAPDRGETVRSFSYTPDTRSTGVAAVAIPASALPWNQVGFASYDEPAPSLRPDTALGASAKYVLATTNLSRHAPERPKGVVLVAHLPEHAALWIEGRRTYSQGRTRHFVSPPLDAGTKYRYALHAVWFEDGRWVGQTREVVVRAGEVRAIYLRLSPEGQVAVNLAKLAPEDRQVAAKQKICVVRTEARLGENGVPVKVLVKGHRVFVCDTECIPRALANPEQTWNRARELRARNDPTPASR